MKKLFLIFAGVLLLTEYVAAKTQTLTLSPVFSSHMVIQRNEKVLFRGMAAPGKSIQIKWSGGNNKTSALKDGSWQKWVPSIKKKGAFNITFISNGDKIVLNDVLMGDVWLCSGQSNMEFQVGNFKWGNEETHSATNTNIRFYSVPNRLDLVPAKEVAEGESWKIACGEDLKQVSATAYCFAKSLQSEIDIPIGLICSDWSGTMLEPWMSRDMLRKFPRYKEVLAQLDGNTESRDEIKANLLKLRETWDTAYFYNEKGIKEQWFQPDTVLLGWKPVKLPFMWQSANVGLDHFYGTVWFKSRFNLPANYKGQSFRIYLAQAKDYSTVWLNGEKIGDVFGDKNSTDFWVPVSQIKEKGNELTVRVMSGKGNGGIEFHPMWGSDLLRGDWWYKVGQAINTATFVYPKIMNIDTYSHPTAIFNAMIAPLRTVGIKGIIWYQGESNAPRGVEYKDVFPAFITDWRAQFGKPLLPFFFVQLANMDPVQDKPGESEWAELREAQTKTLKLPATGMAVAIDLGEANNIHPQNKQEVGRRLALNALEKVYGKPVNGTAPNFQSLKMDGKTAIIQIKSASPLELRGTSINGFELAGADRIYYKAQARLKDGFTIEVICDKVEKPLTIRYDWSKNPGDVNLYDRGNLPLVPFRTDIFPGVTEGHIYDLHKFYL